jgi:hypothetical protein
MTHSQLFTDFANGFYRKMQLKLLENIYSIRLKKNIKFRGMEI